MSYYSEARNLAENAIKLDPTNGRSWFVAALAISRIIDYSDPFTKLRLLRDFDVYIEKAIELLEDPLYKALALIGSAIRYREPPWPFNNYKEAEKRFLKAIEYAPDLPNVYLELGLLYRKTGNNTKAKEAFLKAIELSSRSPLTKAQEEIVTRAEQELSKMR
ncbi:tetratricopeptide repeat protein [Pseudothermotoga thermarum]|uniref:tetratricopeptide repeat protein n=1 Tax=Pseudothermotoga thermarum TaxID=119394 RepID=UPI0002DD7CAF|nr:tetratricopeptide repeat protein [Pseudothermotoga thermarum]